MTLVKLLITPQVYVRESGIKVVLRKYITRISFQIQSQNYRDFKKTPFTVSQIFGSLGQFIKRCYKDSAQ